MTTRQASRRIGQGPTWAIWWLIPILIGFWPLVAFAHYPPDNKPMQFTGPGWIAEAIWIAALIATGTCIAVSRHRAATAVNPAGHPVPRTVNPADSLTGRPRGRKLTDPLGAASKHISGVTRSQGAERRPRRENTPAPPA